MARVVTGIIVLAGGLAMLAGCTTARDPELLNDPNYSTGYADGCQTAQTRVAGFEDETLTRNQVLWENEPAYQTGWRDGYNACGSSTESNTNADRDIFTRESEHYQSVPR
jgi:hypothetical protein